MTKDAAINSLSDSGRARRQKKEEEREWVRRRARKPVGRKIEGLRARIVLASRVFPGRRRQRLGKQCRNGARRWGGKEREREREGVRVKDIGDAIRGIG